MSQSKIIQLPAPLHAQLKALATARGKTMVEVIHDTIRAGIQAGEIPDEVPGVRVRLELDLDAVNNEHGPFVTISTPNGPLPRMTKDDALAVARRLDEIQPGDEFVRNRINQGGQWAVSVKGTGIELWGSPWDGQNPVSMVMTVALARDIARQLRKVAEKAVPDIE